MRAGVPRAVEVAFLKTLKGAEFVVEAVDTYTISSYTVAIFPVRRYSSRQRKRLFKFLV
jgi:hypothetical protein